MFSAPSRLLHGPFSCFVYLDVVGRFISKSILPYLCLSLPRGAFRPWLMVSYVGFGNLRPPKRNTRGLVGVSYKSAGFISAGETHGTDQGLLARCANPGYDRVSKGLGDVSHPKEGRTWNFTPSPSVE